MNRLLLLACVAGMLLGCKNNGDDDAGPSGDGLDAGHNQFELVVKGAVTLGYGSAATGVAVIGRCGSKKFTTKTDDKGKYTFTANVKGCNPLVVEFNKESYLPNYRVIQLPHPTSPMTVDVPVSAMGKLQCGTYRCTVEGQSGWDIKANPMRQGWVTGLSGKQALDYLAGEFRQTVDGKLVSMLGFSYYDWRDAKGAAIVTFKTSDQRQICSPVPSAALDWFGDVNKTPDKVELNAYTLDPTKGRWTSMKESAYAMYTAGYVMKKNPTTGFCENVKSTDGQPIKNFKHIQTKELGDIRANKFTYEDKECAPGMKNLVFEYWVCHPVTGSGWFAWGVPLAGKSCVMLKAKDQCNKPIDNVVFQVKGRDHGYRATAWTNPKGEACLEVIPSEPVGKDYDYDGLGGESFWVDVEFNFARIDKKEIANHKNHKFQAGKNVGCSSPSSCDVLTQTFTDHTITCK